MYRADIIKENGFPSDPEEFGKFIEDPNNIVKIGFRYFLIRFLNIYPI